MDKLQVYRSYNLRRPNQAWWDATPTENGWKVHFHADYVASTDWACAADELFGKIEAEHNTWKDAVDARWSRK